MRKLKINTFLFCRNKKLNTNYISETQEKKSVHYSAKSQQEMRED